VLVDKDCFWPEAVIQCSRTAGAIHIDELTKRSVFTQVNAKSFKLYAAVRNHARHAEWEKLDTRDVGTQLSGLRELLAEHL
jgi:hypothetical protein